MFRYIYIILSCIGVIHGGWQSVLPWQVKTTLLELSEQFEIHSVRGDPTPIYREDLPKEYIAYWNIPINEDEYVILSSSPKTGDYKLVIQGSGASLLEELDTAAHGIKTSCVRYYMMTPTPDINMMCEDKKGRKIFAENDIVFSEEDYRTIAKLWTNQRSDVENEHVWDQSILNKHQNATYYKVLENGDSHRLVVGDSKAVGIQVMNDGGITDEDEQSKLCLLLNVCHSENHNMVNPDKFEQTKYGQTFIKLLIPHDIKAERTIYLELSTTDNGETSGRRLTIDPKHRSKRQTSPWTYYSINDENLFPDYNQHSHDCKKGWFWNRKKTKCCMVGCGPVAWAMILGYYDRRSHTKPGTYGTGSQNLYKCGSDATSGSSSCKAPSSNTDRLKKLTEYLNDQLGTFCLSGQGATTQGKMKKFENYFKSHQTSGSPSVSINSKGLLSFVGAYNTGIRNTALSYIRSKWPVVVGIRVSGIFSQHYPVATKYRRRTKRECKKNFWGKTKCSTSTEYDMYTHMGWGGSKNGWRPAKMFFAGVARY